MLTIIFGAGASYDSAPSNSAENAKKNPWRPPLTNEIFLADTPWHTQHIASVRMPPDLQPVIERIRRTTKNSSLENALEQLKSEIDDYPDRWKHLLAVQQFIVSVIEISSREWARPLQGITTYIDLVSRVKDWAYKRGQKVNYITFNYDNLIDQAISSSYENTSYFTQFENYQRQHVQRPAAAR